MTQALRRSGRIWKPSKRNFIFASAVSGLFTHSLFVREAIRCKATAHASVPPAMSSSASSVRFLREVAPPLDGSSHKGQGGRVGVIGGSGDYTGAPFYAGLGALRCGAELLYLFTAEEAALPIKTYSPELMVTPVYSNVHFNADRILENLPRLHAVVIGCGLGRQPAVFEGLGTIIAKARELGVPLVFDADGLQLIAQTPSLITGYDRVLLTPNIMEFKRLLAAVGTEFSDDLTREEQLLSLYQKLDGPTLLLKGREDLIVGATSGTGDARFQILSCEEKGTPRRSGGLGDVLAGILGTLLGWLRPGDGGIGQGGWTIADAAMAGSLLTRRSSHAAFQHHGRAMTAPDVLREVGPVFEELCPSLK
eukprot:TRINITY_DN48248_c0_g1_i1.p1 TRINITY_DN48248_c0_g1~~TRINITY_DN48248_c0_g1_i1.p1  ORF type:complete len:379 (+),score=49.50 TRINITY_DN48248_c0_g1_i1:43-1137(+)